VALFIAGVVGAIVPALIVASIVLTHGENAISNDFVRHIGPLDRMLSGGYDLRDYFRDTFLVGSHSTALPFAFHLLSAKFFDWHINAGLTAGIILSLLRVWLLVAIAGLGWRERGWRQPWHWLLALPIAGLVFSATQISTYFGRDLSLTFTLTLLGVVLAVWALCARPPVASTLVIACAGGVIATWSSGAGPFVWPVIVLGMVFAGWRRWQHYLAVIVIGAAAVLPYVLYLDPGASSAGRTSERNLLPIEYFVASIGWPLVNDLDSTRALTYGIVGLALLAAGVVGLVLMRRRVPGLRGDPRVRAVTLLLAYWFCGTYVIAAFRGKGGVEGLLPWYTAPFMVFWIALALLAWTVLTRQRVETERPSRNRFTAGATGWSALALTVTFGLLAVTSTSWRDKGPGIDGRSPMTASCLLDWRNAPPICEHYVFTWGIRPENDSRKLASALEKHELSVFGQRQVRLLQGDWVLDNVHFSDSKPFSDNQPYWTGGQLFSGTSRKTTPERLTLVMSKRSLLIWDVPLPKKVADAVLVLEGIGKAKGVQISINGKVQKLRERYALKKGSPLSVELAALGREVRIEAPRVEYRVPDGASTKPVPVDSWSEGLLLDDIDLTSPTVRTSRIKKNGDGWILQRSPKFFVEMKEPYCASPDSEFRFSMRVDKPVEPHIAALFWRERGRQKFAPGDHVLIPVRTDGKWHDYRFALRLLSDNGRPWKGCIEEIIFSPLAQGAKGRRVPVQIRDVGFTRQSDGCAEKTGEDRDFTGSTVYGVSGISNNINGDAGERSDDKRAVTSSAPGAAKDNRAVEPLC
jgi:hypothetical protein